MSSSRAYTGLHDGKSRQANLLERISGLFGAAFIVSALYLLGLPHAIYIQLTQPNFLHWLNPVRWRNLIVEGGLPKLLVQGDIDAGHLKREAITAHAKGVILELGAGTGLGVKYYNQDAITQLYLVEPFVKLHDELKANIAKMGPSFAAKTTIVPYGVEQRKELENYGIKPETVDTIVLVQVLCSIPNRKEHLPYIQSLLKSGGQILLMEHVASDDRITEVIQNLYNPIWTRLSMGCNVNRHSGNMIRDLGGWKQFQIQVPEGQHSGNIYPRVIGRYVKA